MITKPDSLPGGVNNKINMKVSIIAREYKHKKDARRKTKVARRCTESSKAAGERVFSPRSRSRNDGKDHQCLEHVVKGMGNGEERGTGEKAGKIGRKIQG